jgi:hypothetical protein
MSLALKSDTTPQYATKTETHYLLRVPMSAISKAIREGKIELHLIDGKIQLNVTEVQQLFAKKKKNDLFT